MVERPEQVPSPAYLLASAMHLKQAAVRAGRPDVAAKAAEAVTLLGESPVDDQDRDQRGEVGNAVLRILDGLGF